MLCWSKVRMAPRPDFASAARVRASRYLWSRRKSTRSSKSTAIWPRAISGRCQLWPGSMSSDFTILGSAFFFLAMFPPGAARVSRDRATGAGSCQPRAELFRHPVGALRAVTVDAVVDDVVAVFDQEKFDRPFGLARQALGVLPRHDAVELAGDDEQRAPNSRGDALQRQRRRVAPRFLRRSQMAADAEGFAREAGQPVPGLGPVVGTGER